ncbi:MAG: hypothetical protein CL693_00405 [Cellvibrionaceae bacterium]|nr:hypothetical protein [Cellvibrionaceae bacterium]|tara:strand:- start:18599 stop:20044 length:1446 start_codon:yes stop_codon:yes gene_type:complete
MTTATHLTIATIFENKRLFFELMDRHNTGNQASGFLFLISEYDHALNVASKSMDAATKNKFIDALSLDNLKYNDLLETLDYNEGHFSLNAHVEGLLRQLEAKRIRELSDYDLDLLVGQIDSAYAMAMNVGHHHSVDLSYKEMFEAVRDTFYSVAAKLRVNVKSLKGHAEQLSEIVDSVDFAVDGQYLQYRKTMDRISQLYQRNVLPTLLFLDPTLDIKRTQDSNAVVTIYRESNKAPMRVMKDIVDHFDLFKAHEQSLILNRLLLDIKSLGRDIVMVAEQLSRYLKMDEEDRRFYNAAEERFNRLKDVVRENQRGQQRGYLLQATAPIFKDAEILGLLKAYGNRHAQAVNWPRESALESYQEHLRVRLESLKEKTERQKPDTKTRSSFIDTRKSERLMITLDAMQLPESTGDLHALLHQHLANAIEDYELSWLGEAVEYISTKGKIRNVLNYDSELQRITYKGFELGYRSKEFIAYVEKAV